MCFKIAFLRLNSCLFKGYSPSVFVVRVAVAVDAIIVSVSYHVQASRSIALISFNLLLLLRLLRFGPSYFPHY